MEVDGLDKDAIDDLASMDIRGKTALDAPLNPELAHLVRNVRRTARPGAHVGVRRQVPRFPGVLLVAVAAAGLLLPQRFSRGCPQPGYRSGHDQGPPGGDPRPAPLHGPGHPGDIEHDGVAVAGDREYRQSPRVA